MTEDEAKTKWCPFARQMVTLENGGNPIAGFSANRFKGENMALCVGSGCMAWRVGAVEFGPVVERIPARAGSRKPEGEGWAYASPGENPQGGPDWARRAVTRPGFCGLAGAPS